jgi:hypothetical protein
MRGTASEAEVGTWFRTMGVASGYHADQDASPTAKVWGGVADGVFKFGEGGLHSEGLWR